MAVPRSSGPSVWVTWLTKLLSGENSCEWAGWFKAQHEGWSWQRVPSVFDQSDWETEHTALSSRVRDRLETEGKTVFTGDQNSFTLRGASAALGGKPDLIAVSGSTGTIIDVRTGSPSPAHRFQVMVYMYAVPRGLRRYQGVSFDGKVVYEDHEEHIPASDVDETFISSMSESIHRSSSTVPARKVPSPLECGFCNITKEDCPERAAGDTITQGITADS